MNASVRNSRWLVVGAVVGLLGLAAGTTLAQATLTAGAIPPELKAALEAKAAMEGKAGGEAKPDPSKGPDADKDKEKAKKDDKDKSKPAEGVKPVVRPTKPPVAPNPDEFKKVRPDKSGKVAFNFTGQAWPDVMQWLAEVSQMSLDWQELPGDYLNLTTQRSYTLEEARELIQRHLLARGYALLMQGEVLSVVNLKKLDPALLPRVEPAQLAQRKPCDFVKVSFTLDSLAAETAVEELKPMLSPYGKLTPMATTNRIEAVDAVANLREIAALLQQEQSADSQGRLVREFVLKYARATEVLEHLQTLLGLEGKKPAGGPSGPGGPGGQPSPEQLQQIMQAQMQAQQQGPQQGKGPPAAAKAKPEVSLVANRRRNSLLVRAPADKMAIVEQAVKTLDVSTADGQALAGTLARTQVYRLAAIDPEPLVKTLEEIGNLDPVTRLQVDKPNRSIIAFAPLADQVTIRALIDKLDGSGRRFEVVQLRRLAADYVAGTLDFLMTGGKKEQPQRRSWWDSPWQSSRSQHEEKPPEFRVDADVEHNRLLLWANDIEIAEVQKLLVKLGEIAGEKGSGSVRVLDARDDAQTREWLDRVRQAWPGVAPNPLVLPPSDAPPVEKSPRESPPAKPRDPPPLKNSQTQAPPVEPFPLEPVLTPYLRFAQLRTERPEAPASAPPVTISRGPDGQLILSCPDPQALDRLEELMSQLSPPPRIDYKIYRLKYAYATNLVTILRDAFKESDEKPARRSSFFWDDFPPPRDESDSKVTRLSKRRPLRIIADIDSNSLLVQGADAGQTKKIEELIEFYDRPEPTDARSMRKTSLIQLRYVKAKAAAEMVKDVYRDLLSANDKALQGDQKRPERTYNYIFDSSGSDAGEQQKTPRFKGLLSLGVDELSNALIVSAPVFLFEDIQRLINELDQAAEPTYERVEVIKLAPGASGSQMRSAIHRVFGDGSDLPPLPSSKTHPTAPPAKSDKAKNSPASSSGQHSGTEHSSSESSHSDKK